jgi:hypothetical protein
MRLAVSGNKLIWEGLVSRLACGDGDLARGAHGIVARTIGA